MTTSSRRLRPLTLSLTLLLSAGLLSGCSGDSEKRALAARQAPEVSEEAVVPAQERPATLPAAKVDPTETCGPVFKDVRVLVERFPSAVMLDDQGNEELTEVLGKLADRKVCNEAEATSLYQTEIEPWLHYAPPGVEVGTPAPAATPSETPTAAS